MVFESLWFEQDPEKGFSQAKFLEKAKGYVQSCIIPDGDLGPEPEKGRYLVDIKYTDQSDQIEDMFDRMGIKDIDGARNTFFRKDMEYVEVVATQTVEDRHGQRETRFGTYPWYLDGEIVIQPKGLRIIT